MNMKKTAFAASCLIAGSLFAGVPTITPGSVSMEQDSTHKVTIRYRLTGEPGIVTIDIQTNYVDATDMHWASIGGSHLTHMFGAVNRINTNTSTESVAYWRPEKAWKDGGVIANGGVRAVVTAWATNAPPDYMVVNLQMKGDYEFYTSAEAIPGGVNDRLYKTTKMIMRKVPAGGVTWRMGSPSAETNRSKGNDWSSFEPARLVTLSEDYYLAIFELTAGQWDTACVASGNTWARTCFDRGYTGNNAEVYPLTGSQMYWGLRGNLDPNYRWPDKGYAVPSAYGLGGFRNATGLLFDLPTSAEWEFACRAGSGYRYCYGEDPTAAELGDYAWYTENSDGTLHEVGLKKPNAWGFYDMHGNAAEIMREPAYFPSKENPETPVVDPTIPLGKTDSTMFTAGATFCSGSGYLRSAARICNNNDCPGGNDAIGARLWAPAVVSY